MPCLTESRAQATARVWPLASQLTLGPLPTAVAVARGHAVAQLWEWRLDSLRDDAALITSELVTNAVAASRALDGGPWPLRFSLASDRADLLICVADMSPEPPVRADAGSDAIDGRGLMIVEAVSERWGWHRAGSGKIVWAVCALPD
jgi:anti-sigma regulatory factor (Ser/Thr protein kinase)